MANKDALLGVLQQRMDKCTAEQFWAVGAITGVDAFLLTQASKGIFKTPSYFVIITVVVLAFYGLYFIISRHFGYFYIYDKVVDLIGGDVDTPEMFKKYPSRWKGHNLSGVVFYCFWIIAANGATIIAYQ